MFSNETVGCPTPDLSSPAAFLAAASLCRRPLFVLWSGRPGLKRAGCGSAVTMIRFLFYLKNVHSIWKRRLVFTLMTFECCLAPPPFYSPVWCWRSRSIQRFVFFPGTAFCLDFTCLRRGNPSRLELRSQFLICPLFVNLMCDDHSKILQTLSNYYDGDCSHWLWRTWKAWSTIWTWGKRRRASFQRPLWPLNPIDKRIGPYSLASGTICEISE